MRARSRTLLLLGLLRVMTSFGVSVGAHAIVASPALIWAWLNSGPELDVPGEEGTADQPGGEDGGEMAIGEQIEEVPVNVTIYEEPVEAAVAEVEPAPPVPSPAPRAAAKETPAKPAEQGSSEGTPDTQSDPDANKAGAPGRPPRGKKKPCENIEEIVESGENRWTVERDVIDFYASHIKELNRIVRVDPHKNESGKLDGFRVWLSRCSVLRQAGLRHADVVTAINGRTVATLPAALGAWLALRNESNIKVNVTRKNGEQLVFHYRIRK